MNEASKTRELFGELETSIIQGDGIDIGCGQDPISQTAKAFDFAEGDANEISKYVHKTFDFVFSSHCLEHMHNPKEAIVEWWKLVKPGGHMILVVPDEDLYEQGYFPSIFNQDHKATFTISKTQSWSPVSYNLIDLAKTLEKADILKIQLQDANLDRNLLVNAPYRHRWVFPIMTFVKRLSRLTKFVGINRRRLSCLFHAPYDQTLDAAVAQIQLVLRKHE